MFYYLHAYTILTKRLVLDDKTSMKVPWKYYWQSLVNPPNGMFVNVFIVKLLDLMPAKHTTAMVQNIK